MIEQWSPDWSTPVFSLEERDRRWAKVRALMARDGIDVLVCMPCTNHHNRGQADPVYLTQLGENDDEVSVVFPIEGDVTAWLSRAGVWPASNWLTDIRQAPRGTGGATAANRLKEMDFSTGTIGVAALTGGLLAHVRETEGEVNWQSVEIVKQAFPNARVVSATELLGEARFQKSEEELEFIKKGAEIAEKVIETIKKCARAGVREREVYGQMLLAYAIEGGSFQPMVGWISGPLGHTYHRVEVPSFRTLQTGDIIATEIEGRWGGYIAQLDQQFCIGPAPQDLKDGMKLTWECYDRAIELLKPGITVGEVLDRAGSVKGMNGRGEARLIMHGRGTGDDGPLVTTRITPALRAVELKEGCSLIVKPSVAVAGKSDFGHWGESIVVRRNGAERLGRRPQELPELV
jgi:Xaa-Pro aminopeptidase